MLIISLWTEQVSLNYFGTIGFSIIMLVKRSMRADILIQQYAYTLMTQLTCLLMRCRYCMWMQLDVTVWTPTHMPVTCYRFFLIPQVCQVLLAVGKSCSWGLCDILPINMILWLTSYVQHKHIQNDSVFLTSDLWSRTWTLVLAHCVCD